MGNIQFDKVTEIQEKFQERKKRNPELKCEHNEGSLKEYYLGTATGDYICRDCGEVIDTR